MMKKNISSWKNHQGKILNKVGEFEVISCKKCQFNHIIPFPTQNTLEITYKKDFYTQTKPQYFEKHKQDANWWNMVYEERLERMEKLLPNKKSKKILDVGSGPGFFIKFAQSQGWDAQGLEPSEIATIFAIKMGAKTKQGFFTKEAVKGLGKFDVIHMQGVMEHLQNPIGAVKLIHSLLKSNGLFCTVVANDFNPIQEILINYYDFKPWWIVPSEHINYFNITSLKKLLTSNGFRISNVITSFPIDLFLLMGDNYVGNDAIGKESHKRRKNLEFALRKSQDKKLKDRLYKSFAKNNIGRDIEITGQKTSK